MANIILISSALYVAAQDTPPGPSRGAASADGIYIRMDGSAQSIRLPTYDLGWAITNNTFSQYNGPAESHTPRATGHGISGAVGYVFRDAAYPNVFGSNLRVELGFSHVNAKATQSGESRQTWYTLMQVSGYDQWLIGCACATTSRLDTDYTSWQGNLKAASDFRSGALTLTPSWSLFGGHAQNHQKFVQKFYLGGVVSDTYNVSSDVDWTDLGAKFGIDAKLDLATWLTVDVRGTIGFAHRNVDMSASDVRNGLFGTVATFAGAGATTVPLLANVEAGLTIRPSAAVTLRGFAGLNYDSDVPGISAPTAGSIPASALVTGNFQGTPAGIKFSSETSYYAGGSATVKF